MPRRKKGSLVLQLSITAYNEFSMLITCLESKFVVNNNNEKAGHEFNYPILKLGYISDRIVSAISSM
jgi:hypothetical protein